MNITILHNEHSGFRNRIGLISNLHNKLQKKHNSSLIAFKDISSFNLDLIDFSNQDLVIISGGDSTVSYLLNRLSKFNLIFLIIPTGTGNDFAKSLKMTRKIKKNLEAIDRFEVQKISNIISNNNQIIINFICFGFAAKVNRFANKFPRFLGINKYTIATLISLFGKIDENLKFESDEFNENGQYTLAMLVVNSNNFGKGFTKIHNLSRNSIHLLLIDKISKIRFLYLFFLLQIRRHEKRKEFRVIPLEKVKVSQVDFELIPQADGEKFASGTLELKVEFNNLQFLRI